MSASVPLGPVVAWILLATLAGGRCYASDRKAHVRGINRAGWDAGALLAEAARRCPSLRDALAALDKTNVIVLVEFKDVGPRQPPGALHYIGTGHGYRYVQIILFPFARRNEQIATLAHELQHAMEIAADPSVRDQASLRELYRRIGDEVEDNIFETDLARQAYRLAIGELTSTPARTEKR